MFGNPSIQVVSGVTIKPRQGVFLVIVSKIAVLYMPAYIYQRYEYFGTSYQLLDSHPPNTLRVTMPMVNGFLKRWNSLFIFIGPTCVMWGFWRFHSTCRAHHSIFPHKQTVKGYFVNNKKVSATTSDSFLPKCKESKL